MTCSMALIAQRNGGQLRLDVAAGLDADADGGGGEERSGDAERRTGRRSAGQRRGGVQSDCGTSNTVWRGPLLQERPILCPARRRHFHPQTWQRERLLASLYPAFAAAGWCVGRDGGAASGDVAGGNAGGGSWSGHRSSCAAAIGDAPTRSRGCWRWLDGWTGPSASSSRQLTS